MIRFLLKWFAGGCLVFGFAICLYVLLVGVKAQKQSAGGAAAVLRGAVTRYHLQILATNRDDRAVEYRVEAEMRLTVEDVQQRKIIVEQPVTASADYVVSETLVPTDIARERALQTVARAVGERVVSLILDRF
jgi:hypothetical protein